MIFKVPTGARTLTEQTIYGSSRLGTFTSNTTILVGASDALPTAPTIYSKYGNRKYEISNHLGNVLAVVSDEKDASGKAIVLDKQDYYAFGSPLPKNNEAAMVLFEGNYAQETTTNSNSGWIESNGNGILETIANTGLQLPVTSDGKGARKAIDLLRDRDYTFTANFSNLPSDIMTYPITVEIINKANNEVLLQRTTTTSNIEFGFKAPITGDAEVKIYLRNPVTGTVPDYNLTYAKLSKAAYNFPTSVPASEMEVVSNFNIGERSDGGSFDLPINNAGWVGNSNTNLVGIWESSNNDIGVMIANNPNANVSLSKTLFLGAGSYTFSLFDYFESVAPFWQQLERDGSFNNARLYNVIISGTGVGTITGRTNFETTEEGQLLSDITFNVNTACNVTINIQGFDDTHTLAFGSLNLYKTVPAATPETNSWASNYRYGFNTQQKQDDIYGPGNHTTALYWEYDTRLGRRWNLDPKPATSISRYAVFANSPFWSVDELGDTIRVVSSKNQYLFSLDDGKTTVKKVSATYLYHKMKVQWFEPCADNYMPLTDIAPDLAKSPAVKAKTWEEVVQFAEVERPMAFYFSGMPGDWKKRSIGGAGYTIVTVDGYPYWGDAVGQIPFAVDLFTDRLRATGNVETAINETLKIGKKYGDGTGLKADNSNEYDNYMILRAALWASRRFKAKESYLGGHITKKDVTVNPYELMYSVAPNEAQQFLKK